MAARRSAGRARRRPRAAGRRRRVEVDELVQPARRPAGRCRPRRCPRSRRGLALAGGEHALALPRRRAAGPRARSRRAVGPLDVDEQVDAVQQRAAQPAPVAREVGLRAAAARAARANPHGHGFVAATSMNRAGKHRAALAADDRRRGRPRAAGAAPRASARGNSASSSRNSTPWWASVASPGTRHARRRRRARRREIVWCGARNGRRVDEPAAVAQARDAVDARDLERLLARQRRQDRRQAPGEHRLARARRPAEQQVVAAGGRDRRAPRSGAPCPRTSARSGPAPPAVPALAVAPARRGCRRPRRAGSRRPRAASSRRRRPARRRAPPRRTRSTGTSSRSTPAPRGALGHRERAAARAQLAAERQLAEHRQPRRARSAGSCPLAARTPQRDRQVEARARLAQRGRREVDGDAACAGTRSPSSGSPRARARAPRARPRSARPTIVKRGSPARTSTSTVTCRGVEAVDGEGGDMGEHGRRR